MKYIPVLPSSLLSTDQKGSFNLHDKKLNDFALKSGVIVATYEIDSQDNISKNHIEYDVMTVEQNGSMGTSSVIYKRCALIEGFGGIGDFTEVKRRQPSKNVKNEGNPQDINGSIVLLLCLSGNKDKGIIIGALKHPKRKTKLTKDKGHHLEGEFNGVNWRVDKDGALTITFKSATDNDGKPQDTKAGGTTLKMDKTGSVDVNSNLSGNDETYVRMDKPNKDIGLKAGQHIGLTAKKNIALIAEANINAKATADLLADAGGSMTLKSAGAFNINSGAALNVKAASIQVISDGIVNIKGTAVQISAPTVQVGNGGGPAVTMTTQFIGIGNLGGIVVSTAVGPFSNSVFIGS